MFLVTPQEDIVNGRATDAYFQRTEDALESRGKNPFVVADVAADQFGDGEFEVLCGINDAAELLAESSDEIKVWSLPEGSLFDGGPVMRIAGPYLEFARYETSLLGFLSHASGIATKSWECTRAAQEFENPPSILSFGARHVHPSIAPVVERSALVGGVDGFSHVAAGDFINRDASGTTPHALVLAFGTQEEAWSAFNESAPDDTPRIVISDTFTDESDEALRAAEELGDDLDGVRLDTTGSRRGDFRHIIKEVRWKLDDEGFEDVSIFVSGGLGPSDVSELGDIVDGFGIGGYISNADPVDFSLDIVERDGEAVTKRGKLPGIKEVRQNHDETNGLQHQINSAEECDAGMFELLVEEGEVVQTFEIEEAQKNRPTFKN